MLDPTVRSARKALEKHHLFPRGWLEEQGIEDIKLINQIANFSLVDWDLNNDISDQSPEEYVPELRKKFDERSWRQMCELHALPEDWEKMSYEDFLPKRRQLMAGIIKKGFESIT